MNWKKFDSVKSQFDKKSNPGKASLTEMEEAGEKILAPSIAAKRKKESELADELDALFYFAVVFRTRKERDEYLQFRKIRLHDEEYVFGSEVDVRPAT